MNKLSAIAHASLATIACVSDRSFVSARGGLCASLDFVSICSIDELRHLTHALRITIATTNIAIFLTPV